ncbi:trypsin-like peptidase domain-containing protein [Reichenbachiella sp. MALMAid0571]|uniref:trypsin-like peptidase domain-containing protein n=1 Tax=Reichenbachiella sp. MALMAid0571 TaxID=3143939 RepID=UPI0032DE909A
MMNFFGKKTEPGKWMRRYTIYLVLVTIAYLIVHFSSNIPKRQLVNFNQAEVDFIVAVKVDTTNKNAQKEIIQSYLFHTGYPKSLDFEELWLIIEELDSTELRQFLTKYEIEESSPFWLTGNMVFFEIIFWSWFGVLASLLFHGTEAIRKGEFDIKEESVHWAKLLYSPLVTIVLILSLDALSNNDHISIDGFDYWLIVLSFVLGYYSRRAIDLLDRVKDIVFRSSSPKDTTNVSNHQLDNFQSLSIEEKKRILRLCKTNLQKEWIGKYDGLHSVKVAEKNPSDWRLIFIVDEKKELVDVQNLVPDFIPFTVDNNKYKLPTAVKGSGKASNDVYNPNQPKTICSQNPKKPGCSISRLKTDLNDTGSIGLKVWREVNGQKKYFLLSCYHVLCSIEFKQGIYDFDKSKETNFDIISPSKKDGGSQVLAKVSEGRYTDFLDAAIAELINPSDLEENISGVTSAPIGKISVTTEHEEMYIIMSGRTSGKQYGEIIEYSTFVTIDGHTTYDVIMTSKMSKGGDSGAIVVDTLGRLVGMVKAGDNEHTYLIPIERILNYLNINPCYV